MAEFNPFGQMLQSRIASDQFNQQKEQNAFARQRQTGIDDRAQQTFDMSVSQYDKSETDSYMKMFAPVAAQMSTHPQNIQAEQWGQIYPVIARRFPKAVEGLTAEYTPQVQQAVAGLAQLHNSQQTLKQDTKQPTDLGNYVGWEVDKWLANNPGKTKADVPPEVKQKAFLEAKRSQAAEAAGVRSAVQGVNLETEPQIAAASQAAKDKESRATDLIGRGVLAAESSATIRRGIELLKSVETGGYDNVKLQAKRLFGVEGADEGELSQALGKAVLSQLRETFGAQFTQEEGNRLIRLEAGFGKSVANNRRLLEQSLKIVERTAKRARKEALARKDMSTVEDIDDLLTFSLSTREQKSAPETTPNQPPVAGNVIKFDANGEIVQ